MLRLCRNFSSGISLIRNWIQRSGTCIGGSHPVVSPLVGPSRARPTGSLVGHDVHEREGLVRKAEGARNRPTDGNVAFVASRVRTPQAALCKAGRGEANR